MSITNLNILLQTLSPVLQSATYVFCCLAEKDITEALKLRPFAIIQEPTDWTIIIEQAEADKQGWAYQGLFQCITLHVHSSLEAVGLTAAVSTVLTEQKISANVVAGYHHDHIFVPQHRAIDALNVLKKVQTQHHMK